MLYQAFMQTVELWIFVGILGLALVAEEVYKAQLARNEAHQKRIDAEIDRLHQ
jgi:hypothetical protein